MVKKRFLLVAPQGFNLYQLIVKNLEYLGFVVVHIEEHGYDDFKYKSFTQRLYNFYRKTFLGDKSFKEKLRKEFRYLRQYQLLSTFERYDYALVLRADFFTKSFIEAVCKSADLSISFHFDGIDRDKEILEYVKIFDKFYVFDVDDVVKYPTYHFLYSPNFYFDFPDLLDRQRVSGIYNVYYVSTFVESRSSEVIELHKFLIQKYSKVCFVIVTNKDKEELIPSYIKENMKIQFEHVPFDVQLQYISNADVIIDLVLADHNGYSFRILEGLSFNKKVITTNSRVLEADFYHPNNFFVLNRDNFHEIQSFFDRPYVIMDSEIRRKYSFTTWLSNILHE